MGVYKKGGKFYIDYYVAGRRKREMIGPDRKLAETVLAKRKVEIAENRYLDKRQIPSVTFGTIANQYLEWSRANKRSYERDETSIKALRAEFGTRKLADITAVDVDAYKIKRAGVVSKASVNRELSCLSGLFKKAKLWGHAVENSVAEVNRFREDNTRMRYLSTEEEAALLAACASHLRPIVVLAINTGMRKGELLQLKWQHVDLENGFIHVEDTKSGKRRDIPMNRTTRYVLERQPRHIRSPYLFCKSTGEPFGNVKKAFGGACRRVELEDVVFHTLRHTFASRLVMAGADLVIVKELLGHSSLDMVLRYAHLSPGHRRAAVRRLDGFTDDSEEAMSQEEVMER